MSRQSKNRRQAAAAKAASNSSQKGHALHFREGQKTSHFPDSQPAPKWLKVPNISTKHWWNRALPYKGAGAPQMSAA